MSATTTATARPRATQTLAVAVIVTVGSIVAAACGGTTGTPRAGGAPRRLSTIRSTPTPACVAATWSLDRKAAELIAVPAEEDDPAAVAPVVAAGAGAVVIYGTAAPANLATQLASLRAGAADGVAPLVMVDEEGGQIQRLRNVVGPQPAPRDLAQTRSPQAIGLTAAALGQSLHALGIQVDLAPVLDLDAGPGPDDAHAVGSRSFSADPAVTSTDGVAFMQGLAAGGVLPVVKGFPGGGTATANADYGVAVTQPFAALEARGDLEPFSTAIRAGAPAVMVANEIVPGLTESPATLSPQVITGLLRGQLGFQGLVLTDSLSAATVAHAGYAVPEAAVAAIGAGADLILYTAVNPNATFLEVVARLVAAVTSGQLPAQRLDDALAHVLRAKGYSGC
jgi:beta-N-acetylhexosaminidase